MLLLFLLYGVNKLSQEKSKFELLRARNVIDILDGDINFGTLKIDGADSGIKISMPYLSGSDLRDISIRFGLTNFVDNQSRWKYLDNLLEYSIENKRENDLIAFLFSKTQFEQVVELQGKTPEFIEYAHSQIVNEVINNINEYLKCSSNKLVVIGNLFVIRELESTIDVSAPSFEKTVDRSYIRNISERAMKDIIEGNYDSAITKARTLLEEVFWYVIEKNGEKPSEKGNIKELYKQVKQLYNINQNKDVDKRINELLSGLEKILSAITEMRNKGSDAHGAGGKRIDIEDYHARLFVNSAITMADFILSVYYLLEKKHLSSSHSASVC